MCSTTGQDQNLINREIKDINSINDIDFIVQEISSTESELFKLSSKLKNDTDFINNKDNEGLLEDLEVKADYLLKLKKRFTSLYQKFNN
jgi:hypothetical protein